MEKVDVFVFTGERDQGSQLREKGSLCMMVPSFVLWNNL